MSSTRKTINTPEILKNEYGKHSSSSPSQSSSTLPPVLDNSDPTLPEQQQEQYNKDKEKENQQSTQPQTSPTTTTSEKETSTVSSGTSDKPLYETRPSKFKMSKWGYLNPKDNPRRRNKKNIFGIVLHHTTHLQYSDKGKTAFNNWYNNNKPTNGNWSANAHAVIDIKGHIEYGVPYEYACVTQGNKTKVNYTYKSVGGTSGNLTSVKYFKDTNTNCIGCEVENYGFFSKTRIRSGKTQYGRGYPTVKKWFSEGDYDIVPLVDYNGKKISFKTQIANIEYPQVQCDAIYDWLKEVMDWLGMDWKFNKDTYKQMFPNMGRSKFFTNGKKSPNYNKPVFIEKDDLYLIDKKGKFGSWAISKDAQEGVRGVYTHSSCISNKTDLCPTPNIIKMLKRFS